MIKLSGLWKNKSKQGMSYLRGTMSPGVDILVFANKKKSKPSDPDFSLCINERQQDSDKKKSAKHSKEQEPDFGGEQDPQEGKEA